MSLGVLAGDVLGVVKDEAYFRSVETLRERFPWGRYSDQTKLLQGQTNASMAKFSDCKKRIPENGILGAATCGALEWRRKSGDTHLTAVIEASCETVGPSPCPVVHWKSTEEVRAEVEQRARWRPWLYGAGAVFAIGAVVMMRRRR